jgi:transcriptional regulator of nitric oxide reductase
VAFLHLPQKNKIAGQPNDLGLAARRAIEAAGGTLFHGFKLCQMTPSDYFLNDDHPTPAAIQKIATCAAEVASSLASERAKGERAEVQ